MSDPSQLVISRVFNASPEAVFKAWTDPGEMLRWGGPKEAPIVKNQGDVRPGGQWSATLKTQDSGRELRQSGVWQEIEAPTHLAYTFGWDSDDERKETLIDIAFEQVGSRTRMVFRQGPFDSVENRDSHREGWSSSFDRLEDHLH